MYMKRSQFEMVCDMHRDVILAPSIDASEAFWFVLDMMEEEVKALMEREPAATQTVQRLKMAMDEVRDLARDVDNGEFGYGQEV